MSFCSFIGSMMIWRSRASSRRRFATARGSKGMAASHLAAFVKVLYAVQQKYRATERVYHGARKRDSPRWSLRRGFSAEMRTDDTPRTRSESGGEGGSAD